MNKIIKIVPVLILLTITNTQTISITTTLAYQQIAIDPTSTTTDIQLQIVNSLMLLSTGNFINQNTTISNIIIRKYTDSTRQYYINLENQDITTTPPTVEQHQTIIRLKSSSLYNLVDFLTLESIDNTTSNLVSYARFIVSPTANTLDDVVNKLSVGFTLVNQTQIANDSTLKSIDENFRKIYNLDGADLSYATTSVSSEQAAFRGYRVFYSSDVGTSDFKFRLGSAVYNAQAKVYYIHNLLQVRLASNITL